jgi:hypothetical protein
MIKLKKKIYYAKGFKIKIATKRMKIKIKIENNKKNLIKG